MSKNKLVLLLIVIACLVGAGIYYFVSQQDSEESQPLTKENTPLVLLAMRNRDQNPEPDNPDNLMNEYFVTSLNPKTGEQKQIALIKNNFFEESFGLSGDTVFFEMPSGEIASLDLKTNEQKTINIPGIIPTNKYLGDDTIGDFIVHEDKLFYLKGGCVEGMYCALGVYDISKGTGQIVLDNLNEKIGGSEMNGTALFFFDPEKNTIKLRNGWADGPIVSESLFEFNFDTNVFSKVDSAGSIYCGENNENCDQKDMEENKRYDEIFKEPVFECGNMVTEEYYKNVTIKEGKITRTFRDEFIIGCLQ